MNNNDIMNFNSKFIRSYTLCPHGVRNTVTDEIVTRNEATILETVTNTYVIEGNITVENANEIIVSADKILDGKNSKKSDYRPHHMREGGFINIRRDEIISQKICSNGVYDNTTENKQVITNDFAMVLETQSKTYVINTYLVNITNSKFVQLPLPNIIATKPTKKADYIGL